MRPTCHLDPYLVDFNGCPGLVLALEQLNVTCAPSLELEGWKSCASKLHAQLFRKAETWLMV